MNYQKAIQVLKSALSEFFMYHKYEKAVELLREAIKRNSYYSNWAEVGEMVYNKKMPIGVPLLLMRDNANLPLFEESDEGAYRWLALMLYNVALDEEDESVPYLPINTDHPT